MDYKIYILTYAGGFVYLDDKDCVEFYLKYINGDCYFSELNITSNSPIFSKDLYSLKDFISNVDKEFYELMYQEKGKLMHIDLVKLKNKLRDQIINKIIE